MLQQLVNGLILGSVYALLALGYTMVYGIIKLINFAHGDIYMMGAFIGYFLINSFQMNFFVALIVAMLATAILGVVIEFLAYRPLRHSTRIAVLITAIGVSFLLEYGMVYLVGANTRAFPQAIQTVRYDLGPISLTNVQLMILAISLILMILLQVIVQKTKMGKAMRAVSVDSDAAQLMGINVNRTISFTFALGSALAGAAGVLIALYYNSLEPLMGVTPGLKSFVAAVLGGIGIIPGAALGGFVIGLLETFATAFGMSDFRDAIVYGILLLILIVRPAGILLLAGYSLISVLVSVGVLNLFYVQILQQIGINIILAVGLNLIVGFSGQFSLGHAGFMAIGAYAAAIIGSKLPTYGAFFGAMLVGALLSGAVALLVGIPTLRLKGDYLAVATLGVSEIIRIFIINGGSLTNGAAGILGIPNFTTWQMVYFFVVITTIATLNFLRSPIGRSTLSVREDEIAAESVGVNTTKIKIIAFVFGAITASIAGSLQAGFIGSVVPKDYTFINSINVLIIVVFGGLGSITGAIVSAIVLGILNMLLQDVASVRMIIYALALVLVMIFRPGGLLGTWELSLSRFFKKSKKEEQN